MSATRLLYRLLLLLWPPRVRRQHGRELERLFVDCLEAARRRHGAAGYARAWLCGMADALVSAPRVYREEWRTRSVHQERWRSGADGVSDVLRDARFAMRIWTRERSFTLTVLATLVV